MKRHRQKPNEEYNFWQPATDMMSGLVFVLVLIIALLGLYLLSDYTGYEEASSVSSEGPSSSGTGWNNNDPGGWYYDGGTGDGDGDGNGQFDQQIIQTGGGGGYGEDGYVYGSGWRPGQGVAAGYGEDGAPGLGGKVWYDSLTINAGQTFAVHIGKGGEAAVRKGLGECAVTITVSYGPFCR